VAVQARVSGSLARCLHLTQCAQVQRGDEERLPTTIEERFKVTLDAIYAELTRPRVLAVV
jgi:hypothetical protein